MHHFIKFGCFLYTFCCFYLIFILHFTHIFIHLYTSHKKKKDIYIKFTGFSSFGMISDENFTRTEWQSMWKVWMKWIRPYTCPYRHTPNSVDTYGKCVRTRFVCVFEGGFCTQIHTHKDLKLRHIHVQREYR